MTIDYPFPLSDGGIAVVAIPLPGLLSPYDAERMKALIDSLVLHVVEPDDDRASAREAVPPTSGTV